MKSAVCLIVKDEVRDVAEWLAYHSLAGFDSALVYDNGSTDGTIDVIKAAADVLDVRLTEWPRSDIRSQMDAYEHACRTWQDEFDWIAFFDVDEFFVLHGPPLQTFLDRPADTSAVAVNWAIFGSNGHEAYPDDLVIRSFLRRAPSDMFVNRHVKSILRPRSLKACLNPHCFDVEGKTADPSGRPVDWFYVEAGNYVERGLTAAAPDFNVAQLNHYFLRSRAHWARKVSRGYPADVAIRKLEQFDEYDRNEVHDGSAMRNAPLVQALCEDIAARVTVGL